MKDSSTQTERARRQMKQTPEVEFKEQEEHKRTKDKNSQIFLHSVRGKKVDESRMDQSVSTEFKGIRKGQASKALVMTRGQKPQGPKARDPTFMVGGEVCLDKTS